MPNTKTTPSIFRCYEAALPDEPMFVILGRDPAGPATIDFWANQRIKMGKVSTDDDRERIRAAVDEAKDFQQWRDEQIAFAQENDQPPIWKLPRIEDERPIPQFVENARIDVVGRMRKQDAELINEAIRTLEPLVQSMESHSRIGLHEALRKLHAADWAKKLKDCVSRLQAGFSEEPELEASYELPASDIAIDPTFREKIAIGLKQVTEDMKDYFNVQGPAWTFIDRINGYVSELEASRVNPYETFAAHLRRQQDKPQSYLWSPGADEDEIRVTPLSFSRMSELLDYATCYGEFDENTPNGTQSEYPNISTPMNDVRRGAIWAYKQAMGVVPDGLQLPVAEEAEQQMKMAVYEAGLFQIPGHAEPQTMEQIAEVYQAFHKPVAPYTGSGVWHNNKDLERIAELEAEIEALKITKDSKPDDLAHAPEVPHHRFSVFHAGKHFAYARGLEVNPTHLTTALDAMAESGWYLIAVFGQTDSQHIGFIFRREVERFSAFEIAHGYGGGFSDTRPRGEEALPKGPLRAYQEGKSFKEIAAEECPDGDEECLKLIGMGRGQMP